MIKLKYLSLFACTAYVSYAANSLYKDQIMAQPQESVATHAVPDKLKAKINLDIAEIYGEKSSHKIYGEVLNIVANTIHNRPLELRENDVTQDSNWYNNIITYMFYAENFGTLNGQKANNFHDLLKMVPYLKQLGVNNVYILPFMDSPMQDSGFDVKNPFKIRPDLGNIDDFKLLVKTLHNNGIKVTSDLVLNHLSDQNEWFQEALGGDTKKLDYFLYKTYMPIYNKYNDPNRGIVVDYKNENGKISSRRLIFPDLTDNHYRRELIKGKPYYFYHTFYPFQIDLNWENPELLYKMLKVVGFWCNQGVDIFRLDAVPFLSKPDGTTGENLAQTHAIISLVSGFIQSSCPSTVLQAEVGHAPDDIMPYFGKIESYTFQDLNKAKIINRTDQVQIVYNFPLLPALWSAILLHQNNYFWNVYASLPPASENNSWATFLRVHDELTLETATIDIRKKLYDKLINNGIGFRDGLGVGGRMANFLDKDPNRISQAFSILLSLPGSPTIYYGDEIGALNNLKYAENKALLRKSQYAKIKSEKTIENYFDSRDINRGPVLASDFDKALNNPKSYSGKIYYNLKRDIDLRNNNLVLSIGSLTPVLVSDYRILAYIRSYNNSKIFVINNLINKRIKVKLDLPNDYKIKTSKLLDLRTNKYNYLKNNERFLILNPFQSQWLKLN